MRERGRDGWGEGCRLECVLTLQISQKDSRLTFQINPAGMCETEVGNKAEVSKLDLNVEGANEEMAIYLLCKAFE